MILRKRSTSISIFQLALALSYLFLNSETYLEDKSLSLYQFAQMNLNNDNGCKYILCYSTPKTVNSYGNGKSLNTLMKDLMHYDRRYATQYDVTAYLANLPMYMNLNASNIANNNRIELMQVEEPQHEVFEMVEISDNLTIDEELRLYRVELEPFNVSEASSSQISDNTISSTTSFVERLNAITDSPTTIDLLVNRNTSSPYYDERPIWQQNLADLNDFNDMPLMDNYLLLLALNDGIHNNSRIDLNIENPSRSMNDAVDLHLESCLPNFNNITEWSEVINVAANGSYPDPDDHQEIEIEFVDNYNDHNIEGNFTGNYGKPNNCKIIFKTKNSNNQYLLLFIDVYSLSESEPLDNQSNNIENDISNEPSIDESIDESINVDVDEFINVDECIQDEECIYVNECVNVEEYIDVEECVPDVDASNCNRNNNSCYLGDVELSQEVISIYYDYIFSMGFIYSLYEEKD